MIAIIVKYLYNTALPASFVEHHWVMANVYILAETCFDLKLLSFFLRFTINLLICRPFVSKLRFSFSLCINVRFTVKIGYLSDIEIQMVGVCVTRERTIVCSLNAFVFTVRWSFEKAWRWTNSSRSLLYFKTDLRR